MTQKQIQIDGVKYTFEYTPEEGVKLPPNPKFSIKELKAIYELFQSGLENKLEDPKTKKRVGKSLTLIVIFMAIISLAISSFIVASWQGVATLFSTLCGVIWLLQPNKKTKSDNKKDEFDLDQINSDQRLNHLYKQYLGVVNKLPRV